jgi:hypothetical protein
MQVSPRMLEARFCQQSSPKARPPVAPHSLNPAAQSETGVATADPTGAALSWNESANGLTQPSKVEGPPRATWTKAAGLDRIMVDA